MLNEVQDIRKHMQKSTKSSRSSLYQILEFLRTRVLDLMRVSKVTLKWTGPVKILPKSQLENNLMHTIGLWWPMVGGPAASLRAEYKSKSSWTLFFKNIISPHAWDSFFFRTLKLASPLSLTSWNFSVSGFWILTKGVKLQPVRGQTSPNSIKVLGMEHPSVHSFLCFPQSANE